MHQRARRVVRNSAKEKRQKALQRMRKKRGDKLTKSARRVPKDDTSTAQLRVSENKTPDNV